MKTRSRGWIILVIAVLVTPYFSDGDLPHPMLPVGEVVMSTDKPFYCLREPVKIAATGWASVPSIGDFPTIFWAITNASDDPVFETANLLLAVGGFNGTLNGVWNQTYRYYDRNPPHGEQVPSGRYTIWFYELGFALNQSDWIPVDIDIGDCGGVIADAGPDQTVYEGDDVQFNGSASQGAGHVVLPHGPNMKVNDGNDTEGPAGTPQVYLDSNGNAYVVWTPAQGGRGVTYFDKAPRHGMLGKDVRVDDTPPPGGTGGHSDIATTPDGKIHVVWWVPGIRYSFSTDNGATFAPSVAIDNGTSGYPARVDAGADGSVHAVWASQDLGGVYYRSSSNGGTSWDSLLRVGDGGQPDVAAVDNSSVYVVWGAAGILFSKKGPTGAFEQPILLDPQGGGFRRYPSIDVLPNGEIFVAWVEYDTDDYRIVFVRSLDNGSSFEPPIVVRYVKPDEHPHMIRLDRPAVAGFGSEGVAVAWIEYLRPFGRGTEARVSVSLDKGRTFGPYFRVDDDPDRLGKRHIAIAGNAQGDLFAAWHDSRHYPHGGIAGSIAYAIWLNVSFDPLTSKWDFDANVDSDGDGDYMNDVDATGPTPTHVYDDDGAYVVTLNVTNKAGVSDSDTCNITVLPSKFPPIADAGGPYFGYEGTPISLNASKSYDPDGDELEFRWDFENDTVWDSNWSMASTISHIWFDDFKGKLAVEVREKRNMTLDVVNEGEYKWYSFVEEDYEQAQSFKPTTPVLSEVVADVSILPTVEPNGDIILHIRETLEGPDIANSSLPPDVMPVGSRNPFIVWPHFTLPDINLTPGQQYFLVFTCPTCTSGYYHVEFSDDTYHNGTSYTKTPWGNGFDEYPDRDLRFATFTVNLNGPQQSDRDYADVTIENVPPTPEWTSQSADGTILYPPYPEGKEILFEATAHDPGIYDTFTYDWDFGDGTILLDAGPSVYHTYGDNDTYIVVLTVTDDDGGVGIDDTPPLLTTNENPVVSVIMPFCIFTEGTDPCEPMGEFTDPGWLDTHSGVWDYGDGTYETAVITEENDPPDATGWNITSHIYGDNGVYNISFTVLDDDGGVGSDWADAYVQNLPPSFTLNAPASVNEGESFVLGITATDPGSDDIIIDIDWGDGSSESTTCYNNGIGPDPPNSGEGVYPFTVYANLTHTYGDNGDFTVDVTVEDDDGGSAHDRAVITVMNLPPEIALPTIPLIFNEGEEFLLMAKATEPGSDDIEFTWDFELGPSFSMTYYNDGVAPDPPLSPWGTFPFVVEDTIYHTYGDNGHYNVTVTATDDDGGFDTETFTIEVRNVEPAIDIGGPYAGNENSAIHFTATASDPGSDDLTFVWQWGDGTTDAIAFYNDGVGSDPPKSPWGTYPLNVTHSIPHIWGDNGNFTVTLTVTDDDGGVATQQIVVTIENVAPSIESVDYYLNASFLFRIAGEKWHNVEIHLYEDNREIGYANITRYPGSPNDQMVAFGDVSVDFSSTYSAIAYYTPEDDPINGQIQGATPAWVIIQYQDGEERIRHTFNVNHQHTWTWEIEDFSAYFLGHNITFVATASDPGSDDLIFTWDWGDGNMTEHIYYNDGVGADPYPSPDVNPITVTDTARHGYALAGTYTITLTVTDDDGGVTSYSFNLTL